MAYWRGPGQPDNLPGSPGAGDAKHPAGEPEWLRAAPPEFMPRLAHLMQLVAELHEATDDVPTRHRLSTALCEVGEIVAPVIADRVYREVLVDRFDEVMALDARAAGYAFVELLDDDDRAGIVRVMAEGWAAPDKGEGDTDDGNEGGRIP